MRKRIGRRRRLEWNHCKFCGSGDLRLRCRLDRYDLDLLECAECRFRFVDFFNAVSSAPMESGWDYETHAERLAGKFARYCDEIERFLPLQGKSLLDVGAGGGDFLFQAQRRGARVIGLDIDLCGIRFARRRYGIVIQPCLLEEWNPPAGGVDIVTMWEVLEHLNNPQAAIAAVCRVLKPGGWLLLSTPCLDSLWDRLAFIMYDLSFGHIQFPLEYRYSWTHLQIFSLSQLVTMLAVHGFDTVFQDRRTEFTYPLEEYLRRVHPRPARKALAAVLGGLVNVLPVKNKMVVYARRLEGEMEREPSVSVKKTANDDDRGT